jgi:hypothetical protein
MIRSYDTNSSEKMKNNSYLFIEEGTNHDKMFLLTNDGDIILDTTSLTFTEYASGATVMVTANNSANETVFPTFVDGATGTQGIETDIGLTYNPSTGKVTATGFMGTLTGNVTGNVTGNTSGTSGSCTGNAGTVTNGIYTTSSVTALNDVSSVGSGAIITDAERSKLNAIEASATADQTAAEIRAAVEAATDSNVFTDADHSKLNAIEASADVTDTANVTSAGALMDSEVTDLAGVKGVTISTLQVKPSEGAFANGDKTKLDAIEASATADQTAAEIRAAVESATDSNVFTDTDHSKLNAIEASADVTDATNVTSAGALMDSEVTDLAGVKGVTISTLQVKPSEGAFANGDKTKLNAIEASADVTDATNVAAAGAVMDTGNETIAGTKTFSSTISGSINGLAATATEATNITASANNSTDETVYLTFVDGATGTQGIETDTGLTYNPSSGHLSAPIYKGTKNILTHVLYNPTTNHQEVLSTSFAVMAPGAFKTTFTVPAGVTEVIVEAGFHMVNISYGRGLYVGLSGNSDASTYTEFYGAYSLTGSSERTVSYSSDLLRGPIHPHWHIPGLTAGNTYHINLGARASASSGMYWNAGGTLYHGMTAYLKVYCYHSAHDHDGAGTG